MSRAGTPQADGDSPAAGRSRTGPDTGRPDTYALALDIGGTKVAAGVVGRDGTILGQARRMMPVPAGRTSADDAAAAGDADAAQAGGGPSATGGPGPGGAPVPAGSPTADEVFARVQECLEDALRQSGLPADGAVGLGCGCSGPMDWPVGEVSPLNIPAWRGFPLRARLRAAYPRGPVLVHNDAVALAAGEHWVGTGRGVPNLLAVTISTGVGGGLVLGGRLLHGSSGNAGHIGHIVVDPAGPDCPCGGRGCLEAVASGPMTVAWARAEGWSPSDGGDGDGRALAAAATAGDQIARRALARSGTAVGRGLASATSLLDLEVAVVAGGFAQSGPLFWDAVTRGFDRHAGMAFTRRLEIRPSTDPGQIALRGAAAFVLAPERYAWAG